jgi:hypothetical protein
MTSEEKLQLEAAFREAEASVRLEGFEITEPYWSVKEQILNGTLDFEQGFAVLESSLKQSKTAAA